MNERNSFKKIFSVVNKHFILELWSKRFFQDFNYINLRVGLLMTPHLKEIRPDFIFKLPVLDTFFGWLFRPVQRFNILFLVLFVYFPLFVLVLFVLPCFCNDLPYACDEEGKWDYYTGNDYTNKGNFDRIFRRKITKAYHRNSLETPIQSIIKPYGPMIEICDDIDTVGSSWCVQPKLRAWISGIFPL